MEALGNGNLPGAIFEPLPRPAKAPIARIVRLLRLAARRHDAVIWTSELRDLARRHRVLDHAIISVHDLVLLPVALAMRGSGRVFFDAREYYPRHFEDLRWWRMLYGPFNSALCARYLSRADIVVTVNDGLAAEYSRQFGIRCGVLPSYPEARALIPRPTAPDRVRMIHHGNASPNRRIELMIDLMRLLPARFTLDLMLVGMDSGYGRTLKKRALGAPNVTFRAPVSFSRLIDESNFYDIGLYLLPPTGFNTRHALPNKFFEYIQARLALAIGPSVEMIPYVQRYGCGVVSDDFTPEAMARKLESLDSSDIDRLKAASHEAAGKLNAASIRMRIEKVVRLGAGAEAFQP